MLLHLYIKDAHQGSITDRGSRRQSFTVKRWGESSRGAWRARLTLSQEKELFLNKKILQQLSAFSPAVPKICSNKFHVHLSNGFPQKGPIRNCT